MKIGILGIPFNGDGTRPDIENPAAALREAGLSTLGLGHDIVLLDHGDLDIPVFDERRDPKTLVLNLGAWQALSRQAAVRLSAIQRAVDFVIIPGGDCSILLGIFGAFKSAGRRVGLVILDGHTDYREPSASPTGEPADLVLAVLTGRGPVELTGLFGRPPLVHPMDVVVCGYREPDRIAESAILHFHHRKVRETGAGEMARRALALLEHLDHLWFHLDVDVLDPRLMPVCFPETDGLGFDEAGDFLSTAMRSGKLLGLSVACYHPRLDGERKAAVKLVETLKQALVQMQTGRYHGPTRARGIDR